LEDIFVSIQRKAERYSCLCAYLGTLPWWHK